VKGEGGGGAQGVRAGGEGEGGVAGKGGVAAEEGGGGGCQTEGGGGSHQTENDGARGVEEESEGGTRSRSGKFYFKSFLLSFVFVLLTPFCRCMRCAKHRAVCERDLEKPKQWACMKCAGLKEKCKWLEVGGLGLVVDKGKGKAKEKEAKEKEVVTSPRGSEKRKKKKTAKVIVDDDEIVEVAGPSGVTHQTCLVLWTWRKLADELMQRTHPRSVERLSQLEGYRQPSLSISCKVKTILM